MRTVGARLGPHAALETARRRPAPAETAEVLSFRAEIAVELRDFDEAERQLARRRAGNGALASLFALVARAALWLKPAR